MDSYEASGSALTFNSTYVTPSIKIFGGVSHDFKIKTHKLNYKLLDIVNDGKIMRHARTRAFEIIENDPKLIKSQNLKKKLLQDYKHMLEFINIG